LMKIIMFIFFPLLEKSIPGCSSRALIPDGRFIRYLLIQM
jgi:hypothetical protein